MNKRQGLSVVFSAIAIQFTLGIAYIWSVYQTGVANSVFKGDNAAAALVFSLVLAMLAVGSVIGGKLTAKYSTRRVVFIGGVILSLGCLLASFTNENYSWLLWVTYGAMGGIGMGCTYSTSIACAQKWYPHKKGLVTGVIVSALGFGGVVFTPIAEGMIEFFGGVGVGELKTFMVQSVLFFVVCTVGSLFIKNPPDGYMAGYTASKTEAIAPKAAAAASKTEAIAPKAVAAASKTEAIAPKAVAAASKAGAIAPKAVAAASKAGAVAAVKDYTPGEMLRAPKFYLIAVTLLLSCMGGLMMIGFAKPIAVAKGLGATATIGVLAISMFNSLGRLFWGMVSDKFGRINTIFVLLSGSAVLSLFVNVANGYSIYILIALIGFFYGGIVGTTPSLTADIFGAKHMAANYGFVLLGFGAGAIVSSQIAGYYKNIASENINLMFPAFVIAACCAAAGIVMMLIVRAMVKQEKRMARVG